MLYRTVALSQKRSAADGETTSTYDDSSEYEDVAIETPVNDTLTQVSNLTRNMLLCLTALPLKFS